MKRVVLLLLVACQAEPADYPIGSPGIGGPNGQRPGGGGADAGISDGGDGDGGLQLIGKVCLITDLRSFTPCNDARAKGLLVTLGTRSATTSDNGVFAIAAPRGSDLTWRVTGARVDGPIAEIITSVMEFGTDNTIPVIRGEDYREILAGNRLTIGDQEGSVVVRVVRGNTPVPNVSASTIDPDRLTLYDGADREVWDTTQTATGARGVIWSPGVSTTLSPATITLTPQGATAVTATATIENQAITFVTRDLL